MTYQTATIEELHTAALTVARAMQEDGGETLAPIFSRLKAELETAKAKANTIDDARSFLSANQSH